MKKSRHSSLANDKLPPEFLETCKNKLKVVAALTVPCTISLVILALNGRDWYSKAMLRNIVVNYPVFVPPIVQILSTILAGLQLYVVFTIFEYSARTRITRKNITLNTLRLWSALSSRRLDFNLQLGKVLFLLTIIAVSAVPASLWAASITPQLSSTSNDLEKISLPILGQDGFSENVNGNYLTHCVTLSNPEYGTFSGCPAEQFFSNIIFSGRSASTPSQNISRLDATQNIYTGRSYGIGAAIGLTDSGLSEKDAAGRDYATNYNYTEAGFQTTISCNYISNSPWQIILLRNGTNGEGVPYIYRAADLGRLGLGFYSTWSLYNDAEIVAWTTNRPLNSTQPLGVVYMAAGSQYSLLSNISCSVDFRPKNFSVQVDRVAKTINVSPGADFTGSLDKDFHLRNIAMQQLGIVSQVSTTLYFSAIGDTLLANMANSASFNSATANLTTVADSFTSMLDSILLALTSAQTQLPGFQGNSSLSQRVPVHLELTVARIGNEKFIIAMAVLNVGIVLVLVFFMIKTRFWKHLPRFSYLDIGSVIVSSAVDGRGIRQDVQRATGSNHIVQGPWTGASDDERIRDIKVGVSQRDMQGGHRMLTLDSSFVTANTADPSRDGSYELLVNRGQYS
ncbi:hypothetical protein B0J14DRAFT_605104 [Halenospora varia]|nr:hypothetical protein B0J14DRAFT_605104 [Halenospora varia]